MGQNDLLDISGVMGAVGGAIQRAMGNVTRLQSLIGYAASFLAFVGMFVGLFGASSNVERYILIFLFFVTVIQLIASLTEVRIVHYLVVANLINALAFEYRAFSGMFYGGSSSYGAGLQITILAVLLSLGSIKELYDDPLPKIFAGAKTVFGGITFVLYIIFIIGAIIAQISSYTMLKFTCPALGVALLFLCARFLPIKGLPVVTIVLLARQFVELVFAASRFDAFQQHTASAGLSIMAAATMSAILLLIAEELHARELSIGELSSEAIGRITDSVWTLVPIIISSVCFLGALGAYFGVVANLSSNGSYNNGDSFMFIAPSIAILIHTFGLALNSTMAIYSAFGMFLYNVPFIAFAASNSIHTNGGLFAGLFFILLFDFVSMAVCHIDIKKHYTNAVITCQQPFLPNVLLIFSAFLQLVGCIIMFADSTRVGLLTIALVNFIYILVLITLIFVETENLEYLTSAFTGGLLLWTLEVALEGNSQIIIAGAVLCYIGVVFSAIWLPIRYLMRPKSDDESSSSSRISTQPVVTHHQQQQQQNNTPGVPTESTTLIY